MTLWVVKGGRGGIREERFRARSVIGIGWGEVGDLSRVAFDPDLLHSFGGSVTVCSVSRNRAEPRVRAMIDDL